MRRKMQQCVRKFIESIPNSALLLIDIGVWPFHDLLEKYPERAKNIGIFEPGTVSVAAGLALNGIIPIVYGINPFIVERAMEQLKLDFIYQKIGGNFVVSGGAYEFSTLGYSHYCPEDVAVLYSLPGFDILTPANPKQFEVLWNACANNDRPSFFRLTDYSCVTDIDTEYGKATVVKKGTKGLVICVAETLDNVMIACKYLDVTVLFYSTLQPFDKITLINNLNEKIIIIEPFYAGTMAQIVLDNIDGACVSINSIGVPRKVIRNYGTKKEKDEYYGLTSKKLSEKICEYINKQKK